VLAIPVILIGVILGIRAMLLGMIVLSFTAYFINSFYSGRLINYPVREQISDIMPSFLLSLFVSTAVYFMTMIPNVPPVLLLLMQLAILCLMTITLAKAFRLRSYDEVRNIIVDKVPKLKKVI